jgi:uncharacterized protein YbjT (DUF2867 family)
MFTVTVFGGTGLFGRRLVRRLVAEGARVRVAVRHAERARAALHADGLDQVAVFRADVRDPNSLVAALTGADAVVNAVSGYVEKRGVTFEAIHVQGAEAVARRAAEAKLTRCVLISGIGADPKSGSPYIRARGCGELAVQRAFPQATIVRPGVMFGPGDALFGTLADFARLLPILPLIGSGRTRLQPIYVEDAVEAVCRILINPGARGQTYELAGPRTYTMRELVVLTLQLAGKRRLLMTIPFAIADVLAWLLEFLPNPPLTTSQVDLLKAENLASGALPGFQDLGIEPEPVEEVVPTYISRSRIPRSHAAGT